MAKVNAKTNREVDEFIMRNMCDFEYFCNACLKIKTKTKGLQPFYFNRGQKYLQEVAEWQISQYGKVRIIIVKGRQQGLSTWVEARGYWKAIHNEGTKVYILTHEGEATKNLFNMAKRYHDNCPDFVRPFTKRSNTKELIFSELESEYAVGTAKTGATGRSQNMQFFHGSECAYWPDAQSIADGALQGLPDEPGTEGYLESTTKTVGDFFHNTWCSAIYPDEDPGKEWNGFIRVFVPWFWEDTYQLPVDADFEMDDEEAEIADIYHLTNEQIHWRRKKIVWMEGDMGRFNREYPASPEDAFNAASFNVLIRTEDVVRARNNGKMDMYMPTGPKILGIDVAREGDDSTAFAIRQGRVCSKFAKWSDLRTQEIVNKAMQWFKEDRIDYISIDMTGGYGAGVFDMLTDWGLGDKITGVNFSSSAIQEELYKNKRTEMWVTMRDWFKDGAQIPDSSAMQTDVCSVEYMHNTAQDKLELEPKKKTKARLGKSPDVGDALGLTFYRPNFVGFNAGGQGMQDSIDPDSFFGEG